MENTVLYFARATQLDPDFAVAWSSLSAAHSYTYAEFDRTPQRLAQAKHALDAALRLAPEAGETQFALGLYRYRGLVDYDGALEAFAKARSQAASQVEGYEFSAYVKRRQGKWEDALGFHRQSLELDPRNPILLAESALTYRALRRFEEATHLLDRGLELEPDSPALLVQKAGIFEAQGKLEPATKLMERVSLNGQDPTLFNASVRHLVLLRRYDEAIRALRRVLEPSGKVMPSVVSYYRASLGIVESLAGETAAATADLTQARTELLALRAQGDKRPGIASDLILSAAFLGDKDTVDRIEAELRTEVERDLFGGPGMADNLAMARARLGQTDAAVTSVKESLQTTYENSLTPALLRLDPLWDPLRSDPRFHALSQARP